MKKGVVMEINKRHIILLTREGEFLRAKKPSSPVDIGEMIVAETIEHNYKKRSHLPAYSALTAILLLSFFLLNPFSENKTYAYLAVDINPSFQFTIGPDGQVLALNQMNAEAAQIVDDILWEEQTLIESIDQIIAISEQKGYLNEGNPPILISSVFTEYADEDYIKGLTKSIDEIAGQAENSYPKANIVLQEGSMEDYNDAEEQGVSFGRLIQDKSSQKIEEKSSIKDDSKPDAQKEPASNEESLKNKQQPQEKIETQLPKKENEKKPESSAGNTTPETEKSRATPEKHHLENQSKPEPKKKSTEQNPPAKEKKIPENSPPKSSDEDNSQGKKQEQKGNETKEEKKESQKNNHQQVPPQKEENRNKEKPQKNEPPKSGENTGKSEENKGKSKENKGKSEENKTKNEGNKGKTEGNNGKKEEKKGQPGE